MHRFDLIDASALEVNFEDAKSLLGKGGGGEVAKGRLVGAEVAVKKLRPESKGGSGEREFLREMQVHRYLRCTVSSSCGSPLLHSRALFVVCWF